MKSAADPGLRLLLLASLCLNLLLFGVVIGHVAKVLDSSLYGQGYRIERLGKLSPASRARVETAFQALRKKQAQEVDALYALKEKIEAALVAQPFNEKAYMALEKEYAKCKDRLRKDVTDTILELSASLTPPERAVLADLYRLPPRAQAAGRSSSKAMPAP